MNLAMWMPGVTEIAIIAGIILVLFGAPRLPRFMRSLGESMVEFKRGIRHLNDPDLLEEPDDE